MPRRLPVSRSGLAHSQPSPHPSAQAPRVVRQSHVNKVVIKAAAE